MKINVLIAPEYKQASASSEMVCRGKAVRRQGRSYVRQERKEATARPDQVRRSRAADRRAAVL